jgi:hypothetical protein
MQPIPPRQERHEPSNLQPVKPGVRRSPAEILIEILSSVRFWGGLSILVALVSLALPWWGVTVGPYTTSSSWGLFFGPQSPQQQTNLIFFQDRLDTALATNYSLMTGLVLLTSVVTAIGAILRRRLILLISLILSIVAVLEFLGDVANAVNSECARTLVMGASCISGLVGQGSSGLSIVTWGFQAGFYTFIASTILLFGTLVLQEVKSRKDWPLSGVEKA